MPLVWVSVGAPPNLGRWCCTNTRYKHGLTKAKSTGLLRTEHPRARERGLIEIARATNTNGGGSNSSGWADLREDEEWSMGPGTPEGCPKGNEGMRIVANMALSVDGRLGAAQGEPRMFGGPADRRRMHEGRAKADMVLYGGATFRDWPLPPRIDPKLVGGFKPTPPLLVVTRQGLLAARPHDLGFPSADSHLLMFGVPKEQSAEHRQRFGGQVVECSDPLKEALAWAESQGAQELLVEGGGELIASLVDSDRLDELRLCLCPLLLGPGGPAAFGGPPRFFSEARELKLLSVEEEGGRLFTSWAPRPRTGSSAGQAGVLAAPPGGGRKDGQDP